ncbi:MAG: DUF6266 family protein [Marinifilaceae bacterium]
MAIFLTPLGQFRNKLGNTVTYTYDGTTIMRAAAAKVRNPRSPKQLQQRTRFAAAGTMARALTGLLNVSYTKKDALSGKKATFVRLNMPAITTDGTLQTTIDYAALQVAYGMLVSYPVKVTWDEDLGEYSFEQGADRILEQCYEPDTLNMMVAVLLNTVTGRVSLIELKQIGEVGATRASLPEGWTKETTKVYTFAMNEELKQSSNSEYHEV